MQALPIFEPSEVTKPERVQALRFEKTSDSVPVLEFPRVRKEGFSPWQNYFIDQPLKDRSVEEQLFAALADAKIWTSKIAMHLDPDTRKRLFSQLDVLHDAEEWDARDKVVNLESYKSLVRAIIHHSIDCRPSLALMPSGNLLAQWKDNQAILTVEFLTGNRARWLVQNHTADGPERVSGTSPLERLRIVLAPYSAERWFDAR